MFENRNESDWLILRNYPENNLEKTIERTVLNRFISNPELLAIYFWQCILKKQIVSKGTVKKGKIMPNFLDKSADVP